MKVTVVGLGSMGRRRIRLFKAAFADAEICGVDTSQERRLQAEKELDIVTRGSIAEALELEPEAAIVSTSPLGHRAVINECLDAGLHVFTELNLVSDGYDEMTAKAREKGLVLFLSSTLIYRAEMKKLKELVAGRKMNYIYHVGQYLPDWHPWESYKNFFVGDRRTNGCRELFAIDMPWIIDVFGPCEPLMVQRTKQTGLDIDYDDSYLVNFSHENGTGGLVAVDVVARSAGRRLEVWNENTHIFWEGQPQTLRVYDVDKKEFYTPELYGNVEHREGYAAMVVENAYTDELISFVGCIEGREQPLYSFEKDKKLLEMIDRIEEWRN